MVKIYHPNNKEVKWILAAILREYLSIDYMVESANNAYFKLSLNEKHLILPNTSFTVSADCWLLPATLPKLPLVQWDVAASGLDANLVHNTIPVLFGEPGFHLDEAGNGHLNLDVFGSAFFMLSRYEEAILPDRDIHDRFPATASIAYQAGFLDRPIIDEYVEILWAAMQRVWPGLERKPRQARTLVSCDVDHPFDIAARSLKRLVRRIGGQALRNHSLSGIPALVRNYQASARSDYSHDPYRNAIDWIMEVNERVGNQVAFYFIPERTDQNLDDDFRLDEPRMRELLRSIHTHGHEIGIHPGYHTYRHPENFARSVATLRRVMDEESIEQAVLGGRQHYLRWETPTTARLWDENGLTYDSTLSYADRPGFRCGTCHEYPMYDLLNRKPLKVRERPLIVMECSVISDRYLGLGYSTEALELMLGYRQICRQFGGDFTLLWHNSYLMTAKDREFYQELIA